MLSTPETLSKVHNSRPAFDWMSMVVAVILVAMLFPTPQPNVQSNQPWRMELLTSLLLLATMIFEYIRDRQSFARIFTFGSGYFGWIFGLLSAFTLWGLASSAWANAPFSAWHHTVIWVNYLIAFLYLRYRIQKNYGTAFITATFFWLALILGSLSLVDYSTSPNFAAVESNIRLRYSKYAELLITALPVLWVTSIYLRQNLGRRLFLLAASIGWLAVMLSLSRGAFIVGVFALAATFGAIILMGPLSIRKRTAKTAALWIILTLVVQFGFSYLSPIPSTSEYISGTSGQGSESSLARVFIWTIGGQMVRDNAILGVGADNFGVAFNRSRAAYRDANPSIPPDERVSDKTIERSHNEFLQIFAELGFVGLVLFGAAFVVVALWIVQTFRRRTSTFSPILISSIAGMAAFLASAGVSSFSFRLAQNGMVFFAVFALATIELAKFHNGHSADQEPRRKPSSIALFFLIASYLLIASVTMGLKGLAEYYILAANQEAESAQAIRLYRRAYTVDPDYSATYLFSSARSYADRTI
ncbi:MAG: O-antigen ligase family protein [Chloracidobacterium sp.]|nr:O-antigen ligase family protein [Chloracidobacterium sp.]